MIEFALDAAGLIVGALTGVCKARNYSNIDDWEGTLMLVRLGLKYQDYDQEQKEKALKDYEDRRAWAKKMLVNISKAGFFSSDRTIKQYNDEVWKLN